MEARKNAFGSALPGHKDRPKHRLVIVSEREYDFGWVFFYNTKEYVDSGDPELGLVGNAPLIVDRTDGKLYVTGTVHPLEYYIEEYRKSMRRRAEQDRCNQHITKPKARHVRNTRHAF
jgi:hypothetical protein